jgi:hypothetical protein
VELKWEVSYSDRYGQARQLAYKLDTIVVDQRIEEVGRPLPHRICLGSLNQIAQELGLAADHGTTSQHLKRAFRQNALAGITAKFKYKGNDGSERTLEATFTRYSVIFTGEKFSDGSKADAVYIELNPTYQEVLNNAPVRPLDLGYKKQLPPGPQRFYEIVSYKIFAALKYNHPLARLSYSEYCTFSAQQRYFDYDHFKKQMYKIHRPHLASGYITKVRFDEATDSEGKQDWIMCYVPGPKARTEYSTFTGNKKIRPVETQVLLGPGQVSLQTGESTLPQRRPRQRRLNLIPAPEPASAPPAIIIDYRVTAELARRGVGEEDARKLLASLKPDQPVVDQLEYGDYQIAQSRTPITNPPGFYISLLQRNVPVPPTFETSQAKNARLKAESAQSDAILQRRQAAEEAEEQKRQEQDSQIAALPDSDRQALLDQAKAELVTSHPSMAAFFKANPANAINDGAVRVRMRQLMSQGWKPHQTINQPTGQAADLEVILPQQPVAGSPHSETSAVPRMTVRLKAILSTPQLPAPSEIAPAATTPAVTDVLGDIKKP